MFGKDTRANCIGYENVPMENIAASSFTVSDPAVYDKLIKQVIDDTLVEEAVMAPLYQANWTIVAKKEITGFAYSPQIDIKYMHVKPVSK